MVITAVLANIGTAADNTALVYEGMMAGSLTHHTSSSSEDTFFIHTPPTNARRPVRRL